MPQPNDLSRSLVALDHNSTIIAVVEMSQSSWLVGGMLPGVERQPRKNRSRPKSSRNRWFADSLLEGTGFELLVRRRGERSAAMLRCTNLFFTQQAPRVGGSPRLIVVSRRWIPFGSRTKRVFIARAREGRDSLSEANGIQ
jgi:hypothetical protein